MRRAGRVQPARLELALLDPQVARELGIVAPHVLDETLAALDMLVAAARAELDDGAVSPLRTKETRCFQRVSMVGAPRFELGTSSPPD